MAQVELTEDEWKNKLTPEQYRVLRQRGTEPPGTGKYLDFDEAGVYACAACGAKLFKSEAKYESTTPGLIGWPGFTEAVSEGAVELRDDNTLSMQRTEVICSTCGSHLGHLFDDHTSPNGKHYCINCVALDFKPQG